MRLSPSICNVDGDAATLAKNPFTFRPNPVKKIVKVYLFEACTPAEQMFLTEKYSAWRPATPSDGAGAACRLFQAQ
jgi:hypothetical protein